MPVRQTKTVTRCKICSHSAREEIEQHLMELRSTRQSDAEGNRVNESYVLAACERLGVVNPTKENITIHFKKHCELIDDDTAHKESIVATVMAQRKLDLFTELIPGWPDANPTPDQEIELLRRLYVVELEERIAAGLGANITHDQYRAILGESTKRRHNEAADSLLGQLVGGLTQALAPGEPRPALEMSVDAEYVEESA